MFCLGKFASWNFSCIDWSLQSFSFHRVSEFLHYIAILNIYDPFFLQHNYVHNPNFRGAWTDFCQAKPLAYSWCVLMLSKWLLKFNFSEKATKICAIFLMVWIFTYRGQNGLARSGTPGKIKIGPNKIF